MNIKLFRAFLAPFGIQPGKTINLKRYAKLITIADRWHGEEFSQWLQDCFMPVGKPIMPGFEDSHSRYTFLFDSWEDAEKDLEDFLSFDPNAVSHSMNHEQVEP